MLRALARKVPQGSDSHQRACVGADIMHLANDMMPTAVGQEAVRHAESLAQPYYKQVLGNGVSHSLSLL